MVMTIIKRNNKANIGDISEEIDRFSHGGSYKAYEFMGCHRSENGYVFRVWAPNARSISVTGDFNDWDRGACPMSQTGGGIWEACVSGARVYDNYKYCIETADGRFIYKSDPYAFHTCTRPENASKIYDIDEYKWTDRIYLENRDKHTVLEAPVNIYEVHLGS